MKILLMLLFMSTSYAGTVGTIMLQGTIAEVLALDIDGSSSKNVTLDLLTPATDLVIASVGIQSNSSLGYNVAISSLNAGKLVHSGGAGIDSVTYTMKYGVDSINLATGQVITQSNSGSYDINKDIKITYSSRTNEADYVAGTYTDTLTFTISTN